MIWFKVNNIELNVEHFSQLSKQDFKKQLEKDLSDEQIDFAYNKIKELKNKSNDDKEVPTITSKGKPTNGGSGVNKGE